MTNSPDTIKAVYDLATKLKLDKDFKHMGDKIMGYADRVLEEQKKKEREL